MVFIIKQRKKNFMIFSFPFFFSLSACFLALEHYKKVFLFLFLFFIFSYLEL